MSVEAHLTVDVAAGYLDRQLDPAAQLAAELHLAQCVPCRIELAASRRLLPGTQATGLTLAAGLALAAGIVIAVMGVISQKGTQPVDVVRAGEAPGAVRIVVVAPAEGASVQRADQLVWQAAGSGLQYRITITDSTGGPVWSGATADTAIAIPAAVPFAQPIFWFVDVLLSDGRARTTGTHRFSIAR